MASTDFRVKNGLTVDTTALVSSTTDATSSTVGGSLTVAGGAAIAKKLYVGTNTSTATLTATSTTDATDTATGGTLTVSGGAAIAKKLFVGGNQTITTASVPTLTLNSTASGSFNSKLVFANSGTNKWEINVDNAANGGNHLFFVDDVATATRMIVDSSGQVVIGPSLGSAGQSFKVNKNVTGAVTSYGIMSNGFIQSDVTTNFTNFYSSTPLVTATTFTVATIKHYSAVQGALNSGSVTTQYGFSSESTNIGATTNYGFYAGDTAAVTTGKTAYGFYSAVNTSSGGGTSWGIYANGTANNYIASKLGISNTSPSALLTIGTAGTTAGTLSLAGSTSGTATLQASAAAGTPTLSLPTATGTLVGTGDTGTVSNTMLANSSITINSTSTALGGSVTLYAGTTTLQTSSANQALSGITSINGGTSVSQTLTIQSTTGIGTSDSIVFKVGNNGATTAMTINTSGVSIYGSGEATATPVGNTLRAPSGAGTNITGANLTITAGNGTGTGGSGSINFQTAPTGSTGSSANTMATVMSINPAGTVSFTGGNSLITPSTNFATGSLDGSAMLSWSNSVNSANWSFSGVDNRVFSIVLDPNNRVCLRTAGNLDIIGNVLPQATTTYTLGNSSFVWSNVYTTSLTATGAISASNINRTYGLPNVNGTASWIKLGTFTTAAQSGHHCFIKVVTSVGYNAVTAQQNEVYIHFLTSNGGSVDANGFGGFTQFYIRNTNSSAYNVKVVGNAPGVSATSYDIWFYQAGAYNGNGSFYTVEINNGNTWTNIATTGSDPGVASSTIGIGVNAFATGSNILPNANNSINLGSASLVWSNVYATTFNGALSGNATTATSATSASTSSTQALSDNSTNIATTNWVNKALYGVRAGENITGGGAISYTLITSTYYVKWTARFIVISDSKGTSTPSGANYYDIIMPTSGSIDIVGTTAVTATANGIPMGPWQALYYDLAAGSGAGATAYHIMDYNGSTANYMIPATWVLLCVSNYDAVVMKFSVGITLAANQTYTMGTNSSVRAQYADLAENYTSDCDVKPGDVVVFGGTAEITKSSISHDDRVAGIVSTDPAYLMNSNLEDGVAVALQGRVPCRVLGPVSKGQNVVASSIPGVAQALDKTQYSPGCVIGKSLEDHLENEIKTIEVVVGRL